MLILLTAESACNLEKYKDVEVQLSRLDGIMMTLLMRGLKCYDWQSMNVAEREINSIWISMLIWKSIIGGNLHLFHKEIECNIQ